MKTIKDCLVLRLLVFARYEEIERMSKEIGRQIKEHPEVVVLPNTLEPVIVPKGTAIEFQHYPRP